jgi:PST family polysaccharide transporter
MMTLWLIPLVIWALHGTIISPRDILLVVSRPLAAGIGAAGVAFAVRLFCAQLLPPLPRLVLESAFLFATFFGMLLFVTGQKSFYMGVLRELLKGRSAVEKDLAPA